MRYVVTVLALINGAWMFADGIYVAAYGKYMGPEKPGPWASLISLTGIDVFKLGPLFGLLGLAWLVFSVAFFVDATWARSLGLILSILTLWYLPFGTVIALVVLVFLIFFSGS